MNKKLPIGPIIAGLVLIALGALFLLQTFGVLEINWDLVWPWALIITGVVFLLQNWRHNWWALFILAIGIGFLVKPFIPGFEVGQLWPIALVAVGLGFVISAFTRRGAYDRAAAREQRIEDRAYRRGAEHGHERALADATDAPRADERDAPSAAGSSRLGDPSAPGFSNGPAAGSRLEDPSAPGFSNGPAAPRFDDGADGRR